MKIKNIVVGDSVQVKKGLISNTFKAEQVCEVIKIDSEYKFRPDVLIKGEFCSGWVNHKDLKRPAQRKPEPQLKQLDQSVFDGLDEEWRFAAVDADGVASYYNGVPEVRKDQFIYLDEPNGAGQSYRLSGTYYASNWQNSLIERDIAKELLEVDLSSELTGSDLARAPSEFKDGDLVFELDFSDGIKLVSLKKAGRLALEDYSFQTRYGFNYLKDGRAYPMFSVPHLIHATKENRKALVTLYGEKSVPQLPSEVGL